METSTAQTRDKKEKKKKKKQPLFFEFRADRRFVVFTVAFAVFTDIFLYGLIVPVFPFALEERTGIREDEVQRWVSVLLAVYGGGLLVASPVCGYLADHTSGRMVPFMAGLLALAASTVMLCVGNSMPVVIVGRLLQGISAAVVWVVGLALLADTVGKDEIGGAMGIVSLALSLGIFTAPLLGGVVYKAGGYYAVFAMAFAIIGVDIVLRLLIIEKGWADKWRDANKEEEEDGNTESPAGETKAPENQPPAQDADNSAQTSITIFNRRIRLPATLSLLAFPRLLCALYGSLVLAILMTSLETTAPLFVRDMFGFNSLGAGLIFLAITIPSFIAPLVGATCDKYGCRLIATAGFVFGAPFFILLRLIDKNTTSEIVIFCMLLVFLGTAMALLTTPMMAEITLCVLQMEEQRPGRFGPNGAFAQGYGLFNIAWAGGSLAGPLLGGFVNDAAGWKTFSLVMGVLCASTAVPIVFYTGGKLTGLEGLKWKRIEKEEGGE